MSTKTFSTPPLLVDVAISFLPLFAFSRVFSVQHVCVYCAMSFDIGEVCHVVDVSDTDHPLCLGAVSSSLMYSSSPPTDIIRDDCLEDKREDY